MSSWTARVPSLLAPPHQRSSHLQHFNRREARQALHQHRRQAARQLAVAVRRKLHAPVGAQLGRHPDLQRRQGLQVESAKR